MASDKAQRRRNAIMDHARANNDPRFDREVQTNCDDCGVEIPHAPGKKPRLGHDFTQWGDGSQQITYCRKCGDPSDFEPQPEEKG